MTFPILRTKRLYLRPVEYSDWEMISYLRSDPQVNALVERPSAKTKTEALAFIKKIMNQTAAQEVIYWVITEWPTSDMIGSICLWNFSSDRTKAEVGYDLSTAAQNKRIMNEAMQVVLAYTFENLPFQRIEAYTHHLNEPSLRLLERNGFIWNTERKDKNAPHNVIYCLAKDHYQSA